jgi:hypothetical protein
LSQLLDGEEEFQSALSHVPPRLEDEERSVQNQQATQDWVDGSSDGRYLLDKTIETKLASTKGLEPPISSCDGNPVTKALQASAGLDAPIAESKTRFTHPQGFWESETISRIEDQLGTAMERSALEDKLLDSVAGFEAETVFVSSSTETTFKSCMSFEEG